MDNESGGIDDMSVKFVNYTQQDGYTNDYFDVYDFLKRINQKEITTENFLWGRWEWMFCLPFLSRSKLDKIGLWKDDGKIVALATFESDTNETFICIDRDYRFLLDEIVLYAQNNINLNGVSNILINDNDRELQHIALSHGYRPTQEKQCTAAIDINDSITYTLPEGFRIVSLADEFDMYKYNRVLWKGFNHGPNPSETEEDLEDRRRNFTAPHVNLEHKIAVAAPDGEFVSFCGVWCDPDTDYALVEPVATDPQYRMMGLGKAAVLEAVRRCGRQGASRAFVGSSQQFYYNIGFYPYSTETFWSKKI